MSNFEELQVKAIKDAYRHDFSAKVEYDYDTEILSIKIYDEWQYYNRDNGTFIVDGDLSDDHDECLADVVYDNLYGVDLEDYESLLSHYYSDVFNEIQMLIIDNLPDDITYQTVASILEGF